MRKCFIAYNANESACTVVSQQILKIVVFGKWYVVYMGGYARWLDKICLVTITYIHGWLS